MFDVDVPHLVCRSARTAGEARVGPTDDGMEWCSDCLHADDGTPVGGLAGWPDAVVLSPRRLAGAQLQPLSSLRQRHANSNAPT